MRKGTRRRRGIDAVCRNGAAASSKRRLVGWWRRALASPPMMLGTRHNEQAGPWSPFLLDWPRLLETHKMSFEPGTRGLCGGTLRQCAIAASTTCFRRCCFRAKGPSLSGYHCQGPGGY